MTVLAAPCGLTMTTTTGNNLPHAIPKHETDQQKNGSSKRVHCEIPHMHAKCRWRLFSLSVVPENLIRADSPNKVESGHHST
jgi:hypothetical protein